MVTCGNFEDLTNALTDPSFIMKLDYGHYNFEFGMESVYQLDRVTMVVIPDRKKGRPYRIHKRIMRISSNLSEVADVMMRFTNNLASDIRPTKDIIINDIKSFINKDPVLKMTYNVPYNTYTNVEENDMTLNNLLVDMLEEDDSIKTFITNASTHPDVVKVLDISVGHLVDSLLVAGADPVTCGEGYGLSVTISTLTEPDGISIVGNLIDIKVDELGKSLSDSVPNSVVKSPTALLEVVSALEKLYELLPDYIKQDINNFYTYK